MGLFDIFKSGEYKKTIAELEQDKVSLKAELESIKDLKLSMEKMTILELNSKITELEKEKVQAEDSLNNIRSEVDKVNLEKIALDKQVGERKKEIGILDSSLEAMDFGLYIPKYDFATALGYKDKLSEIRDDQKKMIKDKTALSFNTNWTVDGSKAKGKKMVNDTIKMMLRAFNGECEAAINKVKYNNIETIEKRIRKSCEDINKMNVTTHTSITDTYLNLKIQELYLSYEYEQKKQSEKEALREQREREREEKALQKEIAIQRKKIEKEITHINNVIDDLKMKLLTASDDEKNDIEKTLEELRSNIDLYEDEKEALDYRIQNLGAGYVYIISNIGAFGENVFKIGVTRRLDPMERVHELGSASVPFKFDVHALIFSYQAYNLEKHLHTVFDSKKLNMVNNRKEFFNISIEEIEAELEKHKDLTIDFTKVPEAQEYRETLKIRETI